ncbi:SDR family oxidoreductase [uncultured Microscilla sp.]|uniref:SDR family oxidoreductase n=1 Tax=uncultured Microscilla sp. TaxID=432653 RepID=UPI00262AEF6E|nr:SDR family oxidoreductase [uncultured Microscilla sp.]
MYNHPFHQNDLSQCVFLITGGAGFIGSNLVEYLLKYQAKEVRVLDNLSTGNYDNIQPFEKHKQFKFIEGDIRDIEACQKACKGVDYISHQAALGSVPRSINDPATTNAVNISGFLNMMIAAKDNHIKGIVYASSSSVYGDSTLLPKQEDKIGHPLSPYAVTKLVNEQYARVFGQVYGLKLIGLRYFNVFGPRQSPRGAYAAVIPLFIQALMDNQPPTIFGDGEQTRDFTFIENVVQANIKAMFASKEAAWGEAYNIGVGGRTSLNELFNILKDKSGKHFTPTYSEPRVGDVRDSLADISKGNNLLGYAPQITIQEGLQLTLDWFKQNTSKV